MSSNVLFLKLSGCTRMLLLLLPPRLLTDNYGTSIFYRQPADLFRKKYPGDLLTQRP